MIVFFIDFVVGECFFYDFLREVFVEYGSGVYCFVFFSLFFFRFCIIFNIVNVIGFLFLFMDDCVICIVMKGL